MSPAVLLAVCSLATFRLTRLVVEDTLLYGPRRWVMSKLKGVAKERFDDADFALLIAPSALRQKLAELLGCPYCVSAYAAGAVYAGCEWRESVPLPLLFWLAIWSGGLVAYKIVDP